MNAVALPTQGGEYLELPDGTYEATPAELERRAQAAAAAQRAATPEE